MGTMKDSYLIRAKTIKLRFGANCSAGPPHPRAFLEELRPPVIFDEIQNVPELLKYVRTPIDGKPRRMGQWLFTGS